MGMFAEFFQFRLTEFIKINIQPRSVFVGMTVKNLDSVSHHMVLIREVAPAIDGSAANDSYNEFGRTGSGLGATGLAAQGPPVGSNALLFGATQSGSRVPTGTVSNFQTAGGCNGYAQDPPGLVTGGNRVFAASTQSLTTIAAGAQANLGKFVYRML